MQGALVIHPDREGRDGARLPAARLEEAAGLALALDLEVRATMAVNLRKLTPAVWLNSENWCGQPELHRHHLIGTQESCS